MHRELTISSAAHGLTFAPSQIPTRFKERGGRGDSRRGENEGEDSRSNASMPCCPRTRGDRLSRPRKLEPSKAVEKQQSHQICAANSPKGSGIGGVTCLLEEGTHGAGNGRVVKSL